MKCCVRVSRSMLNVSSTDSMFFSFDQKACVFDWHKLRNSSFTCVWYSVRFLFMTDLYCFKANLFRWVSWVCLIALRYSNLAFSHSFSNQAFLLRICFFFIRSAPTSVAISVKLCFSFSLKEFRSVSWSISGTKQWIEEIEVLLTGSTASVFTSFDTAN